MGQRIFAAAVAGLLVVSGCGSAQAQDEGASRGASADSPKVSHGFRGGVGGRGAYRRASDIPDDAPDRVLLDQLVWPTVVEARVPAGRYDVRLHFLQIRGEESAKANPGRVTATLGGRTIVEDLPVAEVTRGFDFAQAKLVTVGATARADDGRLRIVFPWDKCVRNTLNAVEIVGRDNDVALRINSGAREAHTDAQGRLWQADRRLAPPPGATIRLSADLDDKGKWANVSDEIMTKLIAQDVCPRPRWYINGVDGMGVVCMWSDREGNTYADILGQGIYRYGGPGGTLTRVDGGKYHGMVNARRSSNGNPPHTGRTTEMMFIQMSLNPAGAGFAPISWCSYDQRTAQVVCPDDGKTFLNFWQPRDSWDYGTVDWTSNPPKVLFIVHHHSKGEAWLSTDGGESFRILFDQGSRVQALGVLADGVLVKALSRQQRRGEWVADDDDEKLVGIHRSTDGGKTWTKVSDIETRDYKGAIPFYKGTAWLNTPEGLAVSGDNGKTWTRVANSPAFTQPVVWGKTDEHMMGVNAEGFHESTDGGTSWKLVVPRPKDKYVKHFFWDPTREVFYAGQYNGAWYRYRR